MQGYIWLPENLDLFCIIDALHGYSNMWYSGWAKTAAVCDIVSANKLNITSALQTQSKGIISESYHYNVHGIPMFLWTIVISFLHCSQSWHMHQSCKPRNSPACDGKAIVYIDFVKDVAPLAISLHQQILEVGTRFKLHSSEELV